MGMFRGQAIWRHRSAGGRYTLATQLVSSSYTYWAYAGALRVNASTQLLQTYFNQNWAIFDIATGGENRVLNGSQSSSFVPVDCSHYVPPNTRTALMNGQVFVNVNSSMVGGFYTLFVRPTGSVSGGVGIAQPSLFSTAGFQSNVDITPFTVSSSQSIDYSFQGVTVSGGNPTNATAINSLGAFIDILGYTLPNGG